MITAVDTNVIVDVLVADRQFGVRSLQALQAADASGRLVICDVVLAELTALLMQKRKIATVI